MESLLLIDSGPESEAVHWYLRGREVDLCVVKDPMDGLRHMSENSPTTVIVSAAFGAKFISQVAHLLRERSDEAPVRLIALVSWDDDFADLDVDAIVIRPFRLEAFYEILRDRPNQRTTVESPDMFA